MLPLLEGFGEVVLYHYDLDGCTGSDDVSSWIHKQWSKTEMKMHRIAYNAAVILLVDFLKMTIPSSQVK